VAVGNKISDNKAGCCTTFAVALFAKLAPLAITKSVAARSRAAIVALASSLWTSLLLVAFASLRRSPLRRGPRIEIVSVGAGNTGTHVFLVVGRNAGDPGTKPSKLGKGGSFPECAKWGADAVVLDPWLMSLGHDGVNEKATEGPRTAKCDSGKCDGKTNPECGKGDTVCYTHGESLGFDGKTVLLFEKAKVV
jgi:hypothetical protein